VGVFFLNTVYIVIKQPTECTNDMHELTKMSLPLPMAFVICSNKMTSYTV